MKFRKSVVMRNLDFSFSFFMLSVETPKSLCFKESCQNRNRLCQFLFSRPAENVSVSRCFSVVMVVTWITSRFLVFSSLKICEELSAKQMPESQQILSLQNRQVESRKRTVRQRFYPKLQNCLFIPAMTPNESLRKNPIFPRFCIYFVVFGFK